MRKEKGFMPIAFEEGERFIRFRFGAMCELQEKSGLANLDEVLKADLADVTLLRSALLVGLRDAGEVETDDEAKALLDTLDEPLSDVLKKVMLAFHLAIFGAEVPEKNPPEAGSSTPENSEETQLEPISPPTSSTE